MSRPIWLSLQGEIMGVAWRATHAWLFLALSMAFVVLAVADLVVSSRRRP